MADDASETLDRFLARHNIATLSRQVRIDIAYQCAMLLYDLHRDGVVCGQLCARNILIDRRNRVKLHPHVLIAAEDSDSDSDQQRDSDDDDCVRRIHRLTPEIARLSRHHQQHIDDRKVDVFAFSLLLFELFAIPYRAPYSFWSSSSCVDEKEFSITFDIANFRLEPPADMPMPIRRIMRACDTACAEQRPDFESLVAHLDQLRPTARTFASKLRAMFGFGDECCFFDAND